MLAAITVFLEGATVTSGPPLTISPDQGASSSSAPPPGVTYTSKVESDMACQDQSSPPGVVITAQLAGVREGFLLAVLAVHLNILDDDPLNVREIKNNLSYLMGDVTTAYARNLLSPSYKCSIFNYPALLTIRKSSDHLKKMSLQEVK